MVSALHQFIPADRPWGTGGSPTSNPFLKSRKVIGVYHFCLLYPFHDPGNSTDA
jgi:hypothetical protein